MDKESEINEMKIQTVYLVWQEHDLMKHKRLTLRMKRVIKEAFQYYSINDICDAIINYSKIFNDPRSWFKVKYPLDTFISEKMDRFLNENNPMQTHYNGASRSGKEVAGRPTPPSQPAISPDSMNDYKEKFIQWKKDKQK